MEYLLEYRETFPFQQVFNLIENYRDHIKVFDLRPTADYEAGHLPHAISLPPSFVNVDFTSVVPSSVFQLERARRFYILVLTRAEYSAAAQHFVELLKSVKCRTMYTMHRVDEFLDIYSFLSSPRNFKISFPNEILHRFMYLGSQKHANDPNIIKLLGITHILNATTKRTMRFATMGVQYCQVPIDDHDEEKIQNHFRRSFEFIEKVRNKKKGKVLVHCARGVSRSATLVIMYLMKSFDMPIGQALEFVKSQRIIIEPNQGFKNQLHEFQETHLLFERSRSITQLGHPATNNENGGLSARFYH